MTNSIHVSVLVPVYNVPEEYLRKCIESLIGQSLREIEIILVDDGSTDESGKICDLYAEKDDRIKVIHQENSGVSAARNTAFNSSSGEYITFVDGDDWLSADTCENAYMQAKKFDLDLVLFGATREYSKSSRQLKHREIPKNKVLGEAGCKFLQQKVLVLDAFVSMSVAKLIRRTYLNINNIYHSEELLRGVETLEFSMRLLENIGNAMFISNHWYHYTYNSRSSTMTFNEDFNYLTNKGFEKIREFIYKSGQKEILLSLLYTRVLYSVNAIAISGYFNPENKLPHRERVKGFMKYLQSDIVQDSIRLGDTSMLGLSRRINLFFIRRKWFRCVSIIARMRRLQRNIQ